MPTPHKIVNSHCEQKFLDKVPMARERNSLQDLDIEDVEGGGLIPAQDKYYQFSVVELKTLIKAIIASGVKYKQIAKIAQVNENGLKQFLHRPSKKPRKTSIFYALCRYVVSLDEKFLKHIFEIEPALRDIFWRSRVRNRDDFENYKNRSDNNNIIFDLQYTISDIFSKNLIKDSHFYSEYFIIRDTLRTHDSEVFGTTRTRLRFKFTAGRLEYLEEETDRSGNILSRRGIVISSLNWICMIGGDSGNSEINITWIKLAGLGLEISHRGREKVQETLAGFGGGSEEPILSPNKYNFGDGKRIIAFQNGSSSVERIVLLALPIVRDKVTGATSIEALSERERMYLREIGWIR